jgi:hypothetical protein
MTTATVALFPVAANAPAAAHAWTTVLRPFLPLPLARARGFAPGRSPTVARQRLHRPSLWPRWRVRDCTRGRTGPWFPPPGGAPHRSREPEKRKPPPARPPARQLAPKRKRKIKGEKGEGASTWKFFGGVFHVLVCVHNKKIFKRKKFGRVSFTCTYFEKGRFVWSFFLCMDENLLFSFCASNMFINTSKKKKKFICGGLIPPKKIRMWWFHLKNKFTCGGFIQKKVLIWVVSSKK